MRASAPVEQAPAAPPAHPARQRIVAAARRRYFSEGFRGVTMDDLAEEIGMSKKTIYDHFPSKTVLLEAVLLDKFQSIEAEMERITAQSVADFPVALRQLLACLQQGVEEIQPPFVRDMRRETPELFQRVEERRAGLISRHFGKVIGEGRRQGLVRKDLPPRLIIETLLGAVRAIMNPPKMIELGLTPKAGFTGIISLILEGALTEKGRAK